MMTHRTAAIQKALLDKWSLAKAGAECLARRVLGTPEPNREADYLRGFQDGWWRGARDSAQIDTTRVDKPGLTH